MTKFRNQSGQGLEDYTHTLLLTHKYNFTPQKHVGQTLFGKKMMVDFHIDFDDFDVLLEMKRQEVKGTAEEKILFTATSLLNVCTTLKKPTLPILCLYGSGWNPGCVVYMRDWCMDKPISFRSFDKIKQLIISHELENYCRQELLRYTT